MRTPLPPFAAIRAFEAAARHLSFKEAARELGLTPTAISHQIKQIESLAGRPLFLRRARQVELTREGEVFAETLTPALETIAGAFARLSAETNRPTVTLGAGPLFASRWLVPRLADFWGAHPQIDLSLLHSPVPVWQQMTRFDLAVAWGRGAWPGLASDLLFAIQVAPVLSPALLRDHPALSKPADLLTFPLLHHGDGSGWRQWFERAGVSLSADPPGTHFEDANVLHQAALSGRGVALGILDFIEDELSAGRMCKPFPIPVAPPDAYYLICRRSALSNEATRVVRDWLLQG